jgi:hypothetical protein
VTDSSEFKTLVRQRMAATGEKYTEAYRALLDAASRAVLPSGHRILPRIAARYANTPAEPVAIRLHLWDRFDLNLNDDELAAYMEADEDDRQYLIGVFLAERVEDLIADGYLMSGHEVVYQDQRDDKFARFQAHDLDVSPDQYVWLTERLTDEEFSMLSDEAMHELLNAEYSEYPGSAQARRER